MSKLMLTRDVTREECPWLSRDIKEGEDVFMYQGYTYGCIAEGVAVCEVEGELPFFELPSDSLEDSRGGSNVPQF